MSNIKLFLELTNQQQSGKKYSKIQLKNFKTF